MDGGFVTVAMVQTLVGIVADGVVATVGDGAVGPFLQAYLGDVNPQEDVAKLDGAYTIFDDRGANLGSIISLPAASSVGFDAVTSSRKYTTLWESTL